MPTETVYGLAADASNALAVAKLFEAKGRPRFNPLIAHVADADMARKVAVFDERAEALAERFWPGPLTLVLPLRDETLACDLARAGLSTVAVRAPEHATAHELIGSLRPSGGGRPRPTARDAPSPTTFEDAVEETGVSAQAWLDGGACTVGIESTVVAVLDDRVRWLRPGVVTRDEVAAVVGPLAEAGGDAGRSPGRLTLHYAPNAPVRVDAEAPEPGEAYLAFGKTDASGLVWNLSLAGDLREAATNLFRMLREADRVGPVAIAVAPIPDDGLGEALNDRLASRGRPGWVRKEALPLSAQSARRWGLMSLSRRVVQPP